MDYSVAQVDSPMAAEDHLSPLLGPPTSGAPTALTPSRQLFEEVRMNRPQERTYQMSTPSPMAQISAEEAMRLEVAQMRAELNLLRAQMGKRDAPDVPPSTRAAAPMVLEHPGRDDEYLGEVDARQEAEEAAQFYKEEWRRMKIQVNDQNKIIAEFKASQQGDGGGRPDPMWQSHGDAWGRWKKTQPPGLPESEIEELPKDESDQYHTYNQNWSGRGYHQEWRGRYDHDGGYWGPRGRIDRKDLVKPEAYGGDISKWLAWQSTFVRYMTRIDKRWSELLKAIEKKRGQVISKADEEQLEWDLWLNPIVDWKEQLMEALESFTSGDAKRLVLTNTECNVFSTWSRLADSGHSMRDEHVMNMRRRLMVAKASVPTKDLEIAIINFEKEIQMYEDASGETFSPIDRTLVLKEMLPAPLRQRVKDLKGNGRFETYEQIRAEALIWIADNPQASKGRLAMATEAATVEYDEVEIPYDQIDEFMEEPTKFGVPSDTPIEMLYTLVKNSRLKKVKGDKTGKSGGKGKGPRRCFECDAEGHIAAECPIRIARVAAGGPERIDDPMKGGKGKGKDKKVKAVKGGGKGEKGGVWTNAGDHGGYWVPTRTQIKGAGGFPFPSQHQYAHPWHHPGKGAQPAAKLMIDNGIPPAEDWSWMQAGGYAMMCRQVPHTPFVPPLAKAPIETSNSFAALETEELKVAEESEVAIPPEPVEQRKEKPMKSAGAKISPRHCCGSNQCRQAQAGLPSAPKPAWCKMALTGCRSVTTSGSAAPGLRTFIELRAQSLRPLSNEWEKLTAILDSGASVTVVPPQVGRDYEVTRGDAAAAGVRYEIADGNEIPNLGEKLLPIMTREGTWRSLKVEVADISRPLQSVRSLIKTGHRVVFGGGDNGNFHYIENLLTGEVNEVEDDGSNYLMTYSIAPKSQASFAGQTR